MGIRVLGISNALRSSRASRRNLQTAIRLGRSSNPVTPCECYDHQTHWLANLGTVIVKASNMFKFLIFVIGCCTEPTFGAAFKVKDIPACSSDLQCGIFKRNEWRSHERQK